MNTHICLIDNYDSFTYNLHQLATALGARVTVIRNDQFQPEELSDFDKLLLSPGPGVPAEAGRLLDTIRLAMKNEKKAVAAELHLTATKDFRTPRKHTST